MKKLVVLMAMIIAIALSGCGRGVDVESLDNARKICEPNGGLEYIFLSADVHTARCVNGARFPQNKWHTLSMEK